MKTLIAAGLLALAAHISSARAAEVIPLQTRVDRMFAPWTKGNAPGCAIGIIKSGRWLARRGYGSADVEHGVRITPETVFYTASVSKQFTAAAVLRLVDQGKATLDDDIRQHIPELPEYLPPIKIRNLMHHASGIPDYIGLLIRSGTLHDAHAPDEIVRLLKNQPTVFPAGLMSSYSKQTISSSERLFVVHLVSRFANLRTTTSSRRSG